MSVLSLPHMLSICSLDVPPALPLSASQAPQLLTSARIRPRSCKSQKELEEEQMQQQFKARPVE